MSADLGNGAAIARLLGDDGTAVVGHLFLWGSGDLGILWTGDDHEISFVDRVLDVDVLAPARAADSAELVEFLETLPVKAL
ncbi:hypothetical protein [uncultured Roseobacter sp.]|uniref:hypothetical protein n=1 Tax=uncultured Roseobacter sp. TaxID=114847 RepID=UPI002614686E|nr:hypothetical protein [uncultured Roseobacter sp.]